MPTKVLFFVFISFRSEGDRMKQSQSKLSRRTWFAGAGTIGTAAVAARLLPGVQAVAAPTEVRPPPEKGGGYQLTDHVRRYYETTRT
jgi:hypothetical protein